MDNRLIFLYCVYTETVGTQKGNQTRDMDKPGQAQSYRGEENPASFKVKCDTERSFSSEVDDPMLSRKAAIAIYAPVP